MKEIEDRHFGAHTIWDEFVQRTDIPSEQELLIRAVHNLSISTILKFPRFWCVGTQAGANKLNAELVEFTTFLGSLRPPPPGIRRF